ncbi:MAG: hypothetical protein D6731_22520 [Planctomycetota bacterium]|nr:MAG: hypothetical protein D6731_22520 [Planctomycetota bacterium]
MDVDSIRSGLEAYRNGLELDAYELARGLRAESEAAAIRRAYEAVFRPEARRLLDEAIEAAEGRGLADDVATLRLLRAGLVRLHVARELSPIDAAIARHGRVVFIELADGSRRPLRDMKLLLATEPDPQRRAEIEGARSEQASLLIPLMSEKIGIEQGIAQELGHANLVALHRSLTGVDPREVAAQARKILDDTADLYREVMGWTVRKRVGKPLADATRGDVPFVLAARYLDYAEQFTAKDMVKLTKHFLGRMGIDLTAGGNLSIEIEVPEAGRPARAYVGAIRVPRDVRLALEVRDGQRDWMTFLEALGRALFVGHIDPDLPFEQRGLGDLSLDHAYGALFKHLLLEPRWLERSLEFTRSKDYLILAYLERLYDLRLCCGRVIYDVALRERGSAEGMEEFYEEVMREAIGVHSPRELFLHDVRTPLHSVAQLRARLFEPLMTLHLLHYFDDTWWANPRAGPFLRQEWWRGRRFTVEELAKDMGYALDSKPLLKLFHKHL